jgi:hypothetical protein
MFRGQALSHYAEKADRLHWASDRYSSNVYIAAFIRIE